MGCHRWIVARPGDPAGHGHGAGERRSNWRRHGGQGRRRDLDRQIERVGGGAARLRRGERRGEIGTRTGERSEEHTSELQSLMSISYAVFCLTQNKNSKKNRGR